MYLCINKMNLLFLILTALVVGCRVQPDELKAPTSSPQLTMRYVIFSADQMRQMGPVFNGRLDGLWTPTHADIEALERRLPEYIKTEQPQLGHLNINAYVRQYWGETTEDGLSTIRASFFCDAEMVPDWQESLSLILDGGDCFFDTAYDPAAQTFLWLTVHGEA